MVPYHLKSSFKLKSKAILDLEKPKIIVTKKGEDASDPYETQATQLPKLSTFISLDSGGRKQENQMSSAMTDEERYQ